MKELLSFPQRPDEHPPFPGLLLVSPRLILSHMWQLTSFYTDCLVSKAKVVGDKYVGRNINPKEVIVSKNSSFWESSESLKHSLQKYKEDLVVPSTRRNIRTKTKLNSKSLLGPTAKASRFVHTSHFQEKNYWVTSWKSTLFQQINRKNPPTKPEVR